MSVHIMIAAPNHKKETRKCLKREHAQAIWMAWKYQGDRVAKQLTRDLGYKIGTFYKTIRNEGAITEAYKSVHHDTKWTPEQRDIAADIVAQNPLLTLREIIAEAFQHGCPRISPATLDTYLETMLITRKRAAFTPQQRNSEETKEKRAEYAR
jgi:hypothetical protein